ncbi:hypothetical protein PAMA_003126 [Pampus argenteus]
MAGYKPKVISLTKRPGQTFGFYLRVEHGEDGHLIRCLEMGGPAELAGMKDGDRILRVNGAFVDGLSHSEVVDLVRNSGVSVIFHILDEASYKQAKAQGVNLSEPHNTPVANGVAKKVQKPKLCYLVKSSSGYGFSLLSIKGEKGLFMTEVISGKVADRAGVKVNNRLLEVNGENVEESTHEQVVDKIKMADGSIMLLLSDEETDRYYQNKHTKIGASLATTEYLPYKPRIIDMTKGPDGYGFLLKEEPNHRGHFIKDIDKGSPAEKAGLKDMDRLVAVDGNEVDGCSHEQVVERIRQSGNKCCLLVVDKGTDHMYKQEKKELKPKLCKMEKAADGYGFHLNGIQGVCGQYIMEVVKGGVADRAGLEDNDIVVEVNGVNVEQSSHEEAVAMIRSSGNSLEMLVVEQSVYDQLKAKGVRITRLLLGKTSYVQVHSVDTPRARKERHEEADRPETPTQEPARERSASVSSSSSRDSVDERL